MSGRFPRSFDELASVVRENEVGRRASIETPFGRRLLAYADLTATGRYLHFVEAWIRRVRPFYANTHTVISSTGRIMTGLRESARGVVHRQVGADEDHVVVFTGSGATAALYELAQLLGLLVPEPLERALDLARLLPEDERPVVFVGPYEHHSNELPWLESIAKVEEIGLSPEGAIDLADLEDRLLRHRHRALKIGSFSAASNVSGILSDVPAIARTLHRGGAFAVFDYAAAAPYVPIVMAPEDPEERLDAIALSTHKFVGGPQASGILVADRRLFLSRRPVRPGGGTVRYVGGMDRSRVDYTDRLDEREESGTPAILGDIRAGAAFLVKEMVGAEAILEHETRLAREALARLSRHPKIRLLGPLDLPRLAILSFNVVGLHHDLVSTLLDHLFGIQNRAGCACAGPYGHRLLGIDRPTSERFRALIARGVEGMKPGWVRLTLPWYASREDVDFLLSAVELVADHGERFVPSYRFHWEDGTWRSIDRPVPDRPPLELTVEALEEAMQSFAAGDHEAPLGEEEIAAERARYLAEARALAARLTEAQRSSPPRWNPPTGDPEIDALVWFRYVHTSRM